MVVVRYAALAALVVWLAGMLTIVFGDAIRHPLVLLTCGAIVLLSLFVIKFVGPPPPAFVPRAAIVALMIGVSALAFVAVLPAGAAVTVNLAFGAILLFWYVHE